MYDLTKKARIQEFLFNTLASPFIGATFALVFPFIFFSKEEDFSRQEKIKVLLWCLYASVFYPFYLVHYIFIIHPKEFREKVQSNFTEQIGG